MHLGADQRREAGLAKAPRIHNLEAVACHEMIRQGHEIIAAATIGFRHIFRRALAVRTIGMGVNVALEEASGRGKDGIKLHRGLQGRNAFSFPFLKG